MAEATKIEKVVAEGVTLDLTMAEVRTLARLTHFVSGSEENSPRKHVVAIQKAIEDALGERPYGWEWIQPERDLFSGSVMAENYEV